VTVASDLAALYAETFLTVPVTVGSVSARGFFSEETVIASDENGGQVQIRQTIVRVLAGTFTVAEDVAATVNGQSYTIRRVSPVGDGLELDLLLTRVRT